MASYRLSHAAQADIISILAWSDEQFGEEARKRYESLIAAAIRGAASATDDAGHTPRSELGDGLFSWHLSQSRTHVPGRGVHRPRHFLICRRDGDVLVIGRVLHDAMDLQRHVEPEWPWEQQPHRNGSWPSPERVPSAGSVALKPGGREIDSG